MSGSAACERSGKSVSFFFFLGRTECWPCVSGAVCFKGDEYLQPCWKEGMQISLSSLRRPPVVIIVT